MGVDPEISVEGAGADFHMRAELLADGIGDDAILHGEIDRADGVHTVPLPVFKRAMIQDNIAPIPHIEGAFAGIGILVALAKTNIADDDIGFSAQRRFARHEADAPARGRLALNREVTAQRNRRFEDDVAADIEDHYAVSSADRVAERSRARIIQVGDVVDRPAAATRGRGAKPLRPGKGR